MITLQEAIGMLHAYRAAKPYIEFKTFVESLERNTNKALIESISSGINVILEGVLYNEWKGKVKFNTPSPEAFDQVVKSGNFSKLQGLLYPMLITEADKKYPNDGTMAEEYLTDLVTYVSEHKDVFNDYNPSYSPVTFVYNFISKNVWNMHKNRVGRHLTKTGFHINAKVNYKEEFDDKIAGDGRNEYGTVVNDSAGDGTIDVKWKGVKGKGGDYIVKPYTEKVPMDELEAVDVQTKGFRTQSENTPIDSSGEQKETLQDTGVYADKSQLIDKYASEISGDVNDAIDVVVDVYTEPNDTGKSRISPDKAEDMKQLLKDAFDGIAGKLLRKQLVSHKNVANSNYRRIKNPEEQAIAKAAADKVMAKVDLELAEIDKTLENTIGSSKFGAKYGFKTPQAKEIWADFVDVLKHQPTIMKWMAGQSKKANAETKEPVEA